MGKKHSPQNVDEDQNRQGEGGVSIEFMTTKSRQLYPKSISETKCTRTKD